jgi:hypothetical protein
MSGVSPNNGANASFITASTSTAAAITSIVFTNTGAYTHSGSVRLYGVN